MKVGLQEERNYQKAGSKSLAGTHRQAMSSKGSFSQQTATEKSILQANKALTDEEWAKKEESEREQELSSQKLQEEQQQVEAQEMCLKENLEQLKKKLEELLKNQDIMLEHQLNVDVALLSTA
ncbi:guanylate-binding protein 6-like [Marmota monax]|uniref:guanylate-binding protein 6-like n=1 Tax=Marmota monax TaxID=9995 RepID=UPI001EB01EAE|nr:guanylate-binding protein 6-like [Marmota monax]